jgi:uncharacterized membrane protein
MEFITFLKLYGIAFLSLIGIDSLWLTKIAPKLYKDNIGHLMAEKPNLFAAGLFYIIYIAGAVYFVIYPAFTDRSVSQALFRGAVLGLVSYATFDLTGQAVFKNWPTKITVIDMLWGTVLTAGVCAISTFIAIKLIK